MLAVVAAVGAMCIATPSHAANFFAERVVAVSPGSPNQPGFLDPTAALGGPSGALVGNASTNVYNLGVGGSLTLGFDGQKAITDGPGPDFIVFENPLFAGGNPNAVFAELAFVEVSSNGLDFARFPTVSLTPSAVPAFGTLNPANVSGFAGVNPVAANVNDPTSPSPFDPAEAGGDAFDLADLADDPLVLAGQLDLSAVRFVRMIDVLGDGTLTDSAGRPIFDPTGPGNGGADIDGLAVLNGVVPEPATLAAVLLPAALLRRRR
ncbi:MAG: hypothetical protein ACFCVE_00585 [Phycisphaerae bacterium]